MHLLVSVAGAMAEAKGCDAFKTARGGNWGEESILSCKKIHWTRKPIPEFKRWHTDVEYVLGIFRNNIPYN